MKRFLVTFLLAMPVAACGGSTPPPAASDQPDWVMKGSGAFGGEKTVVYGVGAFRGSSNPGVARMSADGRARAEVSQVLNNYTAALIKDYQSTTTAGDFSATDEQQMVEAAVKNFTKSRLSGVQIVDRWKDPSDGTFYSLARLDFEGFADMVDRHEQLSDRIKEKVKRSYDRAFGELEEEEMKDESR